MVGLSLGLPAVAGLVAAATGGDRAGIAVAFVVNFAAALCRLSFESIVQRDGPAANRGQAFARFETQFQFGWVVAAVLPVLLADAGAGRLPDGRRRDAGGARELRHRRAARTRAIARRRRVTGVTRR